MICVTSVIVAVEALNPAASCSWRIHKSLGQKQITLSMSTESKNPCKSIYSERHKIFEWLFVIQHRSMIQIYLQLNTPTSIIPIARLDAGGHQVDEEFSSQQVSFYCQSSSHPL